MSRQVWKAAGPAQIGQLAHRAVADLMRANRQAQTLSWSDVLGAVDDRMRLDGYRDRAARQSIAAAVMGYLTVAPLAPWVFVRAEVPLPGVRLDLLWWHPPTSSVMVDEVKTGQSGVQLATTRDQVERYLRALTACGLAAETICVRAVSTRAPHTSWTLHAHGTDPRPTAGRGQRGPPPR